MTVVDLNNHQRAIAAGGVCFLRRRERTTKSINEPRPEKKPGAGFSLYGYRSFLRLFLPEQVVAHDGHGDGHHGDDIPDGGAVRAADEVVDEPERRAEEGDAADGPLPRHPEGSRVQQHAENGQKAEDVLVEQKPHGDHRKIGRDDDERQVPLEGGGDLLLRQEGDTHAENVQHRARKGAEQKVLNDIQSARENIAEDDAPPRLELVAEHEQKHGCNTHGVGDEGKITGHGGHGAPYG